MNPDLLKILANSNKDIDNQKLMDYLSGKLSQQETHELEQTIAGNEFLREAMEGLEEMGNPNDLPVYVEQLNRGLKEQLNKNIKRRKKRQLKENPWIYLALALIIIFCLAGYFIIHLLLK